MNNANEKRLLEFTVYSNGGKSYKLEVKEGKPTRISSFTPYQCEVIYPKDDMFNIMVEIIVTKLSEYEKAYETLKGIQVVYEDHHVLVLNKPMNVLSQKAVPEDLSLNEWVIGYLLHTKAITAEGLKRFKPSICNRLDRNTTGLVLAGKTLAGSQMLSELLKQRNVHKYYRLFVKNYLRR